jgi:hypothetical protein
VDVLPAALAAFPELKAAWALAFLERWPTAAAVRAQRRSEIEAFLRRQSHGQARAAAGRIHAAVQADALEAPPHLAAARAGAIQFAARQLLLCIGSVPPGSSACATCSAATEPTLTARSC